jgi:4-amino-4-deoxy-L-arabinose transferase-like glycosyltransferase
MTSPQPVVEIAERRWLWRLAAVSLIIGVAVLRILYLAHDCPLDLAPDEAHYWDWSRHLDWSYYSKGPLVALLIRVSCDLFGEWSRAVTGNEMLAVRLPAIVCGSLLLASVYVLSVQVYRRERWAFGTLLIALTLPLIAAGSTLMTIDAPFTCAWGWALVFGYQAVFRESWWAWIATGLCVAVGVLAKHTMVLWVPFFGLFLLMTPEVRRWLWSGRFWLMTAIGVLGGMPILIWNMSHGWVTLLHERNHAGADDPFTWVGPLRYLGMQFLVLLGFWFIAWARAAWAHHPGRDQRAEIRYLWWLSVPMVVFFLLFSVRNGGGEANWPVAGYISGMVLTVGWLARDLAQPRPIYRRVAGVGIVLTCILGLALSIAVHEPSLLQPMLLPLVGQPTAQNPAPLRRFDPTGRLRGWRHLAAEVDRLRRELGGDVVLVANSWTIPGELGFYCDGHPQAFTIGPAYGDRYSQYDVWRPNPLADPSAFTGRTFIVIGAGPDTLRPGFGVTEPCRAVEYTEHGQPIATWHITTARDYHGFPSPPPRAH